METRWLYTTSENFAELREKSEKTSGIPIGSAVMTPLVATSESARHHCA